MELTEFHNSPGSLVPTLNAQRWNWRPPALCSSQGVLCHHTEWVPLRCRPSRAWLHTVLVVKMLLVPGMTDQVQKSPRSCMHCLQDEGNLSKVPLHLIVSTASMDLLHIDFTSIKTTIELNRLAKVVNVLVFHDHFTKHIMVYVTPNHTTKTVTKFLYQCYISIFGALARLLIDHSVNFMSNIIGEMCKLLSVKKLQIMPYHPQTGW